jgi:hypothetical protein
LSGTTVSFRPASKCVLAQAVRRDINMIVIELIKNRIAYSSDILCTNNI